MVNGLKKIAFVVENISNKAGIERAVVNTANALIRMIEYDVYIISIHTADDTEPSYIIDGRIKVMNLNIPKESRYVWYVKLVKKLQTVSRVNAIDYMVGTTHGINSCLIFIRKYVKIIGCEHFNYDACSTIMKISKYMTYPLLNALVLLTREDAERYFYVKKRYVIPNMLSFQTEESATFQHKRIISVGRLSRQKGFDYLIQVAIKLKDAIPEWKIDIIGDGIERETLLKCVKENNLENFVQIKFSTDNIMQELLESSIYVMTSRFEGLPMVLIEAQECGLPIVSFDCKEGPRQIIENNKSGYLVKTGDIDSFANNVIDIAKNREKWASFSKRGRENAANYTEGRIIKLWRELFDTV